MIYLIKRIMLVIAIIWCTVPVSKMQDSSQPRIKVEFRLAEIGHAKGLTEAVVFGSGYKVYLHKDIVVTNMDILEAHIAPQDATGFFDIFITFTKEGADKMAKASRAHLNKPLAILIDGKLVAVPQVKSTIDDRTAITGRFTKDEAERIATAINVTSLLGRSLPNDPTQIKIELRLAERVHTTGSTEAVVKDTLEKVYLYKEILISNMDVVGARLVKGYKEGIFDIELALSEEAGERIARASETRRDKIVAVLINGRVVSAAYIIGKLSSPLNISGEFTKQDAERIARALNPR